MRGIKITAETQIGSLMPILGKRVASRTTTNQESSGIQLNRDGQVEAEGKVVGAVEAVVVLVLELNANHAVSLQQEDASSETSATFYTNRVSDGGFLGDSDFLAVSEGSYILAIVNRDAHDVLYTFSSTSSNSILKC